MASTLITVGLVVMVLAAITGLVSWRRAVARQEAAQDLAGAERRTTYDGRYGDATPAGKPAADAGGVAEAGRAAEIARSQVSATLAGPAPPSF